MRPMPYERYMSRVSHIIKPDFNLNHNYPKQQRHWFKKGSIFTKNALTLVKYCQAPNGWIFRLSTVLESSGHELSRYV